MCATTSTSIFQTVDADGVESPSSEPSSGDFSHDEMLRRRRGNVRGGTSRARLRTHSDVEPWHSGADDVDGRCDGMLLKDGHEDHHQQLMNC